MLTSRTSTLRTSRTSMLFKVAGLAAKEVLYADVRNLNAAGFEVQAVHEADVQNLNAAGFEVQEMHGTAGGRSTGGVIGPPIAHGAVLAWVGDVRVDPDPLVPRGVPRGGCGRALDNRYRRAAHRTRRRPGLGRQCAGGSRRGAGGALC